MSKKRGRPETDDRLRLVEVADLLVSGETKTPRSAISRVIGTNDSHIRRLQRKWRAHKDALLADARDRQDAKSAHLVEIGSIAAALAAFNEVGLLARHEGQHIRDMIKETHQIHEFLAQHDVYRSLFEQASLAQELARLARGPIEEIRQLQDALNPLRAIRRR